jgi:hypothetical protein
MSSENLFGLFQRIDKYVLALTECAYDDGSWRKYQAGNERRDVVADRLENRLSELIREVQSEIASLEKKV